MESRAPAVVAVVVTTGPGPGLEAAVASLATQDYPELSILVVANGDAEHVAARVAAVDPAALVQVVAENRGFGAACNEAVLGVEGATFFLFCHDDVRLDDDAVSCLVEAAYRTNAGVVSPKFVAYDDPLTLLHVGQTSDRFGVVEERVEPGEVDHGQQDLERDVFVAPGGTTLVRADLFVTLKGFDPLITVLGEDLDLCWRAQVAGARVIVAPSARVAHRQTIATGERAVTALGTGRASRQDLQRRHRLLVVATGWGRARTITTLAAQLVLDGAELVIALVGRDGDRVGAILGSWRWLLRQRRHVRARRRERQAEQVLADEDLHRLQVGGAHRLRRFVATLLRDGYDRARGILPAEPEEPAETDGVGFAAAFADDEAFDTMPEPAARGPRLSRALTSFRGQALTVAVAIVLWALGSRNLIATHLPLIGRLAPLDSWWSNWRHFFASWSPNGVGSGAPGAPGYGVLAFVGTFVLGRMGILPRAALIFAVPLGAYGVARTLRGRMSNRARLIAALAYAAAPIGLNLISEGRVDALVLVAALPFIAVRLFELLAVPGFRETPYPPAVPFGHRGWRATRAGRRTELAMIVAVATAMVPATVVVVVLVVVAAWLAARLGGTPAPVTPWRLLGSLLATVAVFLAPLTVDTIAAGRHALEVFGLPRGPWSAPSFAALARGADGLFGLGWTGWLLPGAAAVALLVTRAVRRDMAAPVATAGTLALVLALLSLRHWMGPFAPDADVLLVVVAWAEAVVVGFGITSLELDLRREGFGWRQGAAALFVGALVLSIVPTVGSLESGRFNLPTTSVAEAMSALPRVTASGYRVLWLGDPSVLPASGWSVEPGLAAATSLNGVPGGNTLFTPPNSGTSDVLLTAVGLALHDRTVHLGALLAQAGIATVVVMNSPAPAVAGVASLPARPAPAGLTVALDRQTDLSLELETSSVSIYGNADFHGLIGTTSSSDLATLTPLAGTTYGTARVNPGSTVVAGLAPASAFALEVNGHPASRSTVFGWAARYRVNRYAQPPTVSLVLRQFPLNGLLALGTLGLWGIVWLGFGWASRLEWLTQRRRPRRRAPRRRSRGVSS